MWVRNFLPAVGFCPDPLLYVRVEFNFTTISISIYLIYKPTRDSKVFENILSSLHLLCEDSADNVCALLVGVPVLNHTILIIRMQVIY